MKVSKKTNSTVVLRALQITANRYGTPTQIIADHGSDIKKGIEDFCGNNPGVTYTYDITHYNALVLKHALAEDDKWRQFYTECGACRRRLIHTELMPYAPPAARDKSRHLNLERYIRWVDNILYVSRHKKNQQCPEFQKHFSWVRTFKESFSIWHELINILHNTKNEMVYNGLNINTFNNISLTVKSKLYPQSEQIILKIADYCKNETQNQPERQTWLCCSDVIESIFGRFKRYVRRAPMREISRMAMTIPIFIHKCILLASFLCVIKLNRAIL